MEDVIEKYYNDNLKIKDKILLIYDKMPMETTVGRVIFNLVLPERIRFINKKVVNKDLKHILSRIFDEYGMETTVKVADDIKDL
jgi:DNA-directed RNA polymerase subunit beta'